MKKVLGLCLLVGVALLVAAPALAADDHNWKFTGGVRVRADYFENYDFLDESNGGIDDSGANWPFMIRFGAEGDLTENVHGMVELRNDDVFGGSPTGNEAVVNSPGTLPFTFFPPSYSNNSQGSNDIILYQAFIDLKDLGITGFDLKVGRQEYTYGTELLIGDNDFYTGQSYDGVRLGWHRDHWGLGGFYFKVSENNFNVFPPGGSFDTNLWGVTFDFMMDKWGDLGVYYIDYQNLGPSPSTGVESYGARWGRLVAADDQMFDWNLEYVHQGGDINTASSHDADAIEGWFGFNLHGDTMHHRFAVGYLSASGDDPTTADNESFSPLFGDGHAYNRLGNLDNLAVTDVEDINASYTLTVNKHKVMIALHQLALDQELTFGPVTEDEVGTAWDIVYDYAMNENYGFQVGASSLMNGDLIDAAGTPNDDPMRFWGQFALRW